MILKGSQRAGGQELAAHLLRLDDNEHIRVHELRGFASDDLKGAFKEAEAITRATKCQKYLFSLSLNPPDHANPTDAQFERAINRIEETLNLEGQPRAIVFHEKHGRKHAHCVWSRIDADTMTARELGLYKVKLRDVSRDLYLEHGWKMPRGLVDTAERDPRNFTLEEWQKAKRAGVDPRWLKQAVQDAWTTSDNRQAFGAALETRGLFLARGDRRGHVVLDHTGDVHALARTLSLKAKEVRARLGDGSDLKSVSETQKQIAERMTPALNEHIRQSRLQFQKRETTLTHYKTQMTQLHRKEREGMEMRHTQDWERGTKDRQARMPRGFKAIWSFFSGKTGEIRRQNEEEAKEQRSQQSSERHSLAHRQLEERRVLQKEYKSLRSRQAEQLMELRRDVGRYLGLARTPDTSNRQLPEIPTARPRVRARALKLDQS